MGRSATTVRNRRGRPCQSRRPRLPASRRTTPHRMRRSPLLLVYSSAHCTYATLPVTWEGRCVAGGGQLGQASAHHRELRRPGRPDQHCRAGQPATHRAQSLQPEESMQRADREAGRVRGQADAWAQVSDAPWSPRARSAPQTPCQGHRSAAPAGPWTWGLRVSGRRRGKSGQAQGVRVMGTGKGHRAEPPPVNRWSKAAPPSPHQPAKQALRPPEPRGVAPVEEVSVEAADAEAPAAADAHDRLPGRRARQVVGDVGRQALAVARRVEARVVVDLNGAGTC